MPAAKFTAPGKLEITSVPVPEVRKNDDVLIRVEGAGICGTDLQILKVPPGHPATPGVILGHEYAGEIVETGLSVEHLKPGDRVVIDPNITCKTCPSCSNGRPNVCSAISTLGIFLDGGFAHFNVAPACSVHRISPDVPIESAIMIESFSCVLNASRKVALQPGETAVVLGAGPIGVSFSMLFIAGGAGNLVITDISSLRREYAGRICPAAKIVDPASENLPGIISEAGGTGGADVVVDTTGRLLPEALQLCRSGGRVLLFGQDETATAPIRQNEITRREITIMGSYISCFSFPAAIRLLESGLLPLEKIVTHRFPLEKIDEGIAALKKGHALKVLIDLKSG